MTDHDIDLVTAPWQQLSTRVVYENKWIRVDEDTVRVPNGHETIYGIVRCTDAVGILPFVDVDHVLLVQQYRYVAGHPTWEMPTGGRAPHETLEQTAQRELAEEAGFRAGQLELISRFHTSKSVVDEAAYLYVAARPHGSPRSARRDRVVPSAGLPVRSGRRHGRQWRDHRLDDRGRRAACCSESIMNATLDGAVMVIAKAPQAGQRETRLSPPLTAHEAADVAWACLLDTLDAVAAVPARRHVIVLDGPAGDWIPGGFEIIVQRGHGLAERLTAAFADVDDHAIVIAMDTPQVTTDLLARALSAVTSRLQQAAFGPAADGGYWLIGLSRDVDPAAVFTDVPMSTDRTGQVQLDRLRSLDLCTTTLDVFRDLDTFEDLVVLSQQPAGRLSALSLPGFSLPGFSLPGFSLPGFSSPVGGP